MTISSMFGGLWGSLDNMMREKSPLNRVYWKTFAVLNWLPIYILLFGGTEYDKEGKIFAAVNSIPVHLAPQYYVLDGALDMLWVMALPLAISLLIVWLYPYPQNLAFQLAVKSRYRRKEIIDEHEKKYQAGKTKFLQAAAQDIEKQNTAKRKIEKGMSEEDKWREEFFELYEVLKSANFEEVIQSIYSRGGQISWMPTYGFQAEKIDTDALALADTKGLVEIDGNIVSFTRKGKFIAGLFIQQAGIKLDK